MQLKLSKGELLALEALCESDGELGNEGKAGEMGAAHGMPAGTLAAKLGSKPSSVSRLKRTLQEKGLLYIEKIGTAKELRLSPASHAQAFKKLFQTRPRAGIESWLSGCALDVLTVLGNEGASAGQLERECSCGKATIFRALKALREAGVAEKTGGGYRITDPLVSGFTKDFADSLQLLMQKQLRGYTAGVRIRKHAIVRSETPKVPDYFSITGMNALHKTGLEVVPTAYCDYYFNLDGEKRKLTIEEQLTHALVLAGLPQHAGDKTALAIFIKQNRNLNFEKLNKLAKEYGASSLLQELRNAVGYYEKLRDY